MAATDDESSFIIPIANLLAYTFGPAALLQPPWIVVAAAVTAVLLLEGREALHRVARQVATGEALTLGKFLILVGIVLPLLPDHPVVPWSPITPFQVWLALVAVSSLSYASYLLQRYLPMKSGALLPAILGGLYSSTATTVTLARRQKEAGAARADIDVGIIIATAMMYLRIDVVVALFNPSLALMLLPALLALFALASVLALWQWRRRSPALPAVGAPLQLAPLNPLQLGTAATFAILFVVVSLAANWVRTSFGQSGVFVLAGIAGTTDIDPFVLSLAQGGVAGMSLQAVSAAILIAASSNNVLKALYALIFGGAQACRRPAALLCSLGLVGVGVALLYLRRGA